MVFNVAPCSMVSLVSILQILYISLTELRYEEHESVRSDHSHCSPQHGLLAGVTLSAITLGPKDKAEHIYFHC